MLAKQCVRLQDHPPYATELIELARGQRSELRLDRAVDILNRNSEQRRLPHIARGAGVTKPVEDSVEHNGILATGIRDNLFN